MPKLSNPLSVLRAFKRVRPLLSALLIAPFFSLTSCVFAQSPSAPHANLIRIWGHGQRGADYIATLLNAWQAGFQQLHPEAHFDDELTGDASAIGGLYTGQADLAVLDREASFIETDAYQQGAGHPLSRIPVAQGSVAIPHHAPALWIYVNPANPLKQLSMEQLDGIFDADHRLSPVRYRTWGDLGVTGDWAARPIQLYLPDLQTPEMQFFERAAMHGSQKISCCARLFPPQPDHSPEAQIAAALAADKYGLALSSERLQGVKALPLSTLSHEAVLPTANTVSDGSYPLAQTIFIYFNRAPRSALPPEVQAFLRYIVSAQGQAIVARTGGYLPLPPHRVAEAEEGLQ